MRSNHYAALRGSFIKLCDGTGGDSDWKSIDGMEKGRLNADWKQSSIVSSYPLWNLGRTCRNLLDKQTVRFCD